MTEYAAQAVPIRLPWGKRLLLSRELLGLQESRVPFLRNEVVVVKSHKARPLAVGRRLDKDASP